jgi:hypothetical protein
MILLSAHKKQKRVLELTHAHLDGTKHNPRPKMISTYCMPPIQIDLLVHFDSRQGYGWAEFPAPQRTFDDPIPRPLSPKLRVLSVEPAPQESSSKKNRRKPIKRVKFSTVHIREHAVTVGDHDWCEGGLPITLDWKHTETRSIEIDDFEWIRERQGRAPRGRLPKLDYWQRKQLLHRVSGITEQDLKAMEHLVVDSKYVSLKRSKTVTKFPTER